MTDLSPRRSGADTAATVILGVLAVLAAGGAVTFSGFFVMVTDACGPGQCDMSRLTLAYVITWGGVVLAALVGIIGIVRATRRGSAMWVWPAAALAVVAASFGIGALMAASVMPG